jgi:Xaa-Pro aminopeptidase
MQFLVDWENRIDFDKLREERKNRVRNKIKKNNLDAVLLFKAENLRYLTGYRPLWWTQCFLTRNAGLMAVDSEPILFPTSGCAERCWVTMDWMPKESIRPLPTLEDEGIIRQAMKDLFVPAFKELGIKKGSRVGIDASTILILEILKETFPEVDFVDGDECLKGTQIIKTPDEIKLLRQSSHMAMIAMKRAIEFIDLGVRECEILAEAMHSLYSHGMEVPQCSLIVTSGEGTAPLRRFASDREIKYGDLVFLDIGGMFNGYNSDFTRTVIYGEPNEQQKKIYKAVYKMMMAIQETLLPGNTNIDVTKAVRKVVKDEGFEGRDYLGLIGHSIGVHGLTSPIIGEKASQSETTFELEPGMVFSLEPGIFIPGVPGGGGVRLENTILVTEEGNELFTPAPYDEKLLS